MFGSNPVLVLKDGHFNQTAPHKNAVTQKCLLNPEFKRGTAGDLFSSEAAFQRLSCRFSADDVVSFTRLIAPFLFDTSRRSVQVSGSDRGLRGSR